MITTGIKRKISAYDKNCLFYTNYPKADTTTIDDVNKTVNTLQSDFRKKLKKMNESK